MTEILNFPLVRLYPDAADLAVAAETGALPVRIGRRGRRLVAALARAEGPLDADDLARRAGFDHCARPRSVIVAVRFAVARNLAALGWEIARETRPGHGALSFYALRRIGAIRRADGQDAA